MMSDQGSNSKYAICSIRVARILVAIVFLFNISCAIQFILYPDQFSPSFNLSGEAGKVVIQSLGLLFIMWNVPYAFAIIHPRKNYIALTSALIMQAIGVIGESWIYANIITLSMAKNSLIRFIWFDTGGLILLIFARIAISWRGKNG